MKATFFTFLTFFLLLSCKKESTEQSQDWQKISTHLQIKESPDLFNIQSGNFKYTIQQNALPFKRVILLNASLVGYFTELNLENRIIGISSPEYVYSTKIQKLVESGAIQNVGNEQKYDDEKIVALKPDAIFTNYIASFENTYDLLKKNGIQIIFLDEYLELDPLDKTRYLTVFGKLFHQQKLANEQYQKIKNSYDSLKTLAVTAPTSPVVLANEMYGNQWFMPGGKSNLAQFLRDAHASYINQDKDDSKAVPLSFEEVFAKSKDATFWVNVGSHQSKSELLEINPNYAKLPVYKFGKLYALTGREKGKSNDYFESGVLRADLILKDYIRIFHPELLPNHQLVYLKELK